VSESALILNFTALLYCLAFFLHLISFFGNHETMHRAAFRLMQMGFVAATFYFVMEAATLATFFPVADIVHALAFFSWSLAFVYLVLLSQIRSDSFGLVLTPVLAVLMVSACLTETLPSRGTVPQANPFFMLHILCAFFAYASFAISFAAALLYLIQRHELKARRAGAFYRKLPSLEELERLIDQPMVWGTALLVTAILIGFVWSKTAFGIYALTDPKTIATALVTLIYGTIISMRLVSRLRPKHAAVLSVIAFAIVIISFVGMRFIHGSHDFLA